MRPRAASTASGLPAADNSATRSCCGSSQCASTTHARRRSPAAGPPAGGAAPASRARETTTPVIERNARAPCLGLAEKVADDHRFGSVDEQRVGHVVEYAEHEHQPRALLGHLQPVVGSEERRLVEV